MVDKIEKRTIVCSIGKNFDGGYRAILSDTSIDRDDEFMSKELLSKWASAPNQFLPMLIDHTNKVENLIGKWNNAQVHKSVEGHHALSMTPVFFDANPKAVIVKGMLKEGAQLGLSIGAMPLAAEEVKVEGKSYKKWTEAELLEASITPIPSNRNSYLTIAKSFNLDKEDKTMKDKIKKQETEAVEAPVEETTEAPAEETKEEEKSELEETVEAKEEEPAEEKAEEVTEEKAVKSQKAESDLRAHSEPVMEKKEELEINSVFDVLALSKGIKPTKWGEQ